MSDLVPHTHHGHALLIVEREVRGRWITELEVDGRHVVSWPGRAHARDLAAALKAHEQRHCLKLDGWSRIGKLVVAHNHQSSGAPAVGRDADRLRQVSRAMDASWRLLHRYWAAAGWLGICMGQIPLPPPDGARRGDAFYPPYIEPQPAPERSRRARKPRPRRPYPNTRI